MPSARTKAPSSVVHLAALALAAVGCATAALPVEAGFGPTPVLPPPDRERLPRIEVAAARPWPGDTAPVAAPGTHVVRFAEGLDHPRWLLVLPNGDVLVAETNAPERPKRAELMGIRGWIMSWFMQRSGAATPSADRITLLRDRDGDGRAEVRVAFAEGLHSPFGMALVGDELFVANTDALIRFPFEPGATAVLGAATKVADLPGGPVNHHWTKGLIASADGRKLYVGVGSNSNAAEHGIEYEAGRASIWEIDRKSGAAREYATGLRNPVGMAWQGDVLWVAVNERDEIGPDLVPDYLTSVREGGFYGWPYSYYGGSVDPRVHPQRLDLVAHAIRPDYALGAHTASLGLASARGSRLGGPFAPSGMFVGQHGSWNRRPPSGYKVLYVPFVDGAPSGEPIDVLTGFLAPDGKAYGRPVGVAVARDGALLVADDVGNCVWRVAAGPG